jgi:hypothetical protein
MSMQVQVIQSWIDVTDDLGKGIERKLLAQPFLSRGEEKGSDGYKGLCVVPPCHTWER